jgi:hypothetical protein
MNHVQLIHRENAMQIHPLLTKQNQSQLVELLKDARGTIGLAKMQDLLPEHFKLWLGAHDTGCQPYIELKAEGRSSLIVWQGSVWYSSIYEFNDRNKVLGIDPAYLFAQDALVRFFETVQSLHSEILTERSMQKAETKAKQTEQYRDDVEFYKDLLTAKSLQA